MNENNIVKWGPDPNKKYPIEGDTTLCYLKNCVSGKNIFIGEYTYYSDLEDLAENFQKNNLIYHHEFCGDKLIIGKFCCIAPGVKFIMSGATHKLKAFSV